MQSSSELDSDSGGDATSSSSESGNEQKGKASCRDAADVNNDSDASNDSGGDAQLGLSQQRKKVRNDAPQVPRKRGRPRKHNTERKEKPDHTRAQGSAWEEVFGVPAPPPEGAVGPVQCDISHPSMGGLGFFDDAANISIPDAEYDEVLMQFSSPRVGFFEVGKVLRRHNLYYQVCFRFCIVDD